MKGRHGEGCRGGEGHDPEEGTGRGRYDTEEGTGRGRARHGGGYGAETRERERQGRGAVWQGDLRRNGRGNTTLQTQSYSKYLSGRDSREELERGGPRHKSGRLIGDDSRGRT